jgi:hypothetical protein
MINMFVWVKTCQKNGDVPKKLTCAITPRHLVVSQEVKMSRWQSFVRSLELEKRIDFEVGDLGLAGRGNAPSYAPKKREEHNTSIEMG